MVHFLQPLYDRLLIKRTEKEEKSQGGILIPETSKEVPQQGIVLATGKGRLLQSGEVLPLQVHVGEVVFFGKYAGTEVDKDHLIIREEEILGIIED